jgi:hypothetical protein
MTETARIISFTIGEGYWTLCTKQEAVQAFLSDVLEGWQMEVDGEVLYFTEDELSDAIDNFLAVA